LATPYRPPTGWSGAAAREAFALSVYGLAARFLVNRQRFQRSNSAHFTFMQRPQSSLWCLRIRSPQTVQFIRLLPTVWPPQSSPALPETLP
jgi:hypothetical protein